MSYLNRLKVPSLTFQTSDLHDQAAAIATTSSKDVPSLRKRKQKAISTEKEDKEFQAIERQVPYCYHYSHFHYYYNYELRVYILGPPGGALVSSAAGLK